MKNYLKYFFIFLLSTLFLFFMNNKFIIILEKVEKNFENSELKVLENLSFNISKKIISEVHYENLYDTLKNNKGLRDRLESNLEVLISNKYKYAYLVYKNKHNQYKIILDGSIIDKSQFNEPFITINKAWENVYKTKEVQFFNEDKLSNIWRTYLYPIIINNKVEGILAIEFSIDEINNLLNYFNPIKDLFKNILYIFVFFIFLFVLLLGIWLFKDKEILEQKKHIQENENFFKEVINSQDSMIITISNKKIVSVNKSFLEFFEIDNINEFYKKYHSLESIFKALDNDSKNEEIYKSFLREIYNQDRVEKLRIRNNIFKVSSKNVIYLKNSITTISFLDITELKESVFKAKEASKAKSEFLANMSHEIRTPMNAIIGLTDLCLNLDLNKKQYDYISKIKASSSSLLTIINDILDFSKIESGKMTFEKCNFSLNTIIAKLENLFETQNNSNDLMFQIYLDSKLPVNYIGDIVRVEQVIINLLANAFKFTKEGSVELKFSTISNKNSKYNILIEVKDTGIGIDESKIDLLFESFRQSDNSTTREYGGTGLGLTISKNIIELLDGKIMVDSKLGVGSTFTILLNLEISEKKLIDKEEDNVDLLKNKIFDYKNITILIAEDNLANQLVIGAYLEDFNFKVIFANNGEECYEIFHSIKNIDLIFMDINMPKLNGYETSIKIREINKNIPIIALTANARIEDYSLSKEHGMNDHIVKPIDKFILYKMLYDYLPNHKKQINNKNIKKISKKVDIQYNFKFIDISNTLKNLNNNKILYDKILSSFYSDMKNSFILIKKAVYENDKTFLLEYFHTLKSTTGSIGAKSLYLKVNDIYTELQDGNIITDDILKIETLIDSVLNEIMIFKSEEMPIINKQNDSLTLSNSALINKNFNDLLYGLRKGNIQKIKSVQKELEQLTLDEYNKNRYNKVINFINVYNFKQAIIIIEEGK